MGTVYALLAAVIYAVASTLQAWAARRAEGPAVVRHPAYVLGLCGDGLGWVVALAAMALMPLFAVQSILASSLALTAVFVAIVMRVRLRRRDVVCIVAMIPALGVIASSAQEGSAHPPAFFMMLMAVSAAVLTVVSVVSYAQGPAWLAATLGGAGFSGAALCARAIESRVDAGQLWGAVRSGWGGAAHSAVVLLSEPLLWVLAVFSVVGMVMYARSMEVGSPVAATALLWAVEVVIPTVVGVLALGDVIAGGHVLAACVGILAVLVCSSVLATSPAQA